MSLLYKIALQSLCILAFSAVLALGVNALRPDSLPLLYAEQSAVQLEGGDGTIAIKDAAMLFLSKRALFLDARSQFEYDEEHVQGALSLPPEEFGLLFEELRQELVGKELLIAYCDGERCPLSHELAELLRGAGFDNVRVLVNGWSLWKAEGLPVASGSLGN